MNATDSSGMENQIIADPDLLQVRPLMQERCETLARHLAGPRYSQFAPNVLAKLMTSGFNAIGANEGTLWLADPAQEFLLPVFNTGPDAEKFVGTFKQPIDEGLVSMVYASEQAFCEDKVYRNKMQAGQMDKMLGLLTCSMMIAPVVFAGRTRGVISCVTLKPAEKIEEEDPPGFSGDNLRRFILLADVTGALLDGHLVKLCFGVD